MCDDPLKSLEVRVFAALKKIDHSSGLGEKIIGLFEKSITLTNSRWLYSDVLEIFEIANCFQDFFFGLTDLGSCLLRVELEPFIARLGGVEKFTEKGLTI